MTLANKITIVRILLIPVFVAEVVYYRLTGTDAHRWIALGVFLFAALSDGIDGWIARRFNQRSQLGAMLDPLADKLLLLSGLVVLSNPGGSGTAALPAGLVAIFIIRDIVLVLGLFAIQYTCGHVDVLPRPSGKTATVLQMALVGLALTGQLHRFGGWMEFVTLVFTLVSGLLYSRDGLSQIARNPRGRAERTARPPAAVDAGTGTRAD